MQLTVEAVGVVTATESAAPASSKAAVPKTSTVRCVELVQHVTAVRADLLCFQHSAEVMSA